MKHTDLRNIREANNLTGAEMAELLGMTLNQYYHREAGRTRISLEDRRVIKKILGGWSGWPSTKS